MRRAKILTEWGEGRVRGGDRVERSSPRYRVFNVRRRNDCETCTGDGFGSTDFRRVDDERLFGREASGNSDRRQGSDQGESPREGEVHLAPRVRRYVHQTPSQGK